MVFIPKSFKKGDRVRSKKDIPCATGTFTNGHEFTIVGHTLQGYDLVDTDGNELNKVGVLGDKMGDLFDIIPVIVPTAKPK